MIRITTIYNATVIIETPDARILCDPWETQGIYDGAWYRFARVPIPMVRYDLIWVSHIHPDHFDPLWLARYKDTFPDVPIVYTADPGKPNPLAFVHPELGMQPMLRCDLGRTAIETFPCNASRLDMDSALAVTHGNLSLANMNDCAIDPAQIAAIREFCGGDVTAALLKYTSAGPYPQCYMPLDIDCAAAACYTQGTLLNRYRQSAALLGAITTVPFAGDYWLGGRLAHLNPYRTWLSRAAVADIIDGAIALKEGSTLVLEQTGDMTVQGEIDGHKGWPVGIAPFLKQISTYPMPWESWTDEVTGEAMTRAICNATETAGGAPDLDLSIVAGDFTFQASIGGGNAERQAMTLYIPKPYLAGLIAGRAHFNDAEIGSQYLVERVPDEFRRETMEWFYGLKA